MAKLLKIYLRAEKRGELQEVSEAQLEVGTGVEGDHAKGPKRQVTLISLEAWQAACAELGQDLDPIERRANLLVEGLALHESRGREIQIGDALIRIMGETKPCLRMNKAAPGLMDALTPEWRGGAFGEVRTGGRGQAGRGDGAVTLPRVRRGDARRDAVSSDI